MLGFAAYPRRLLIGGWCVLAGIAVAATAIAGDGPPSSPGFRQAMRQLLEVADERGPTAFALAQRRFQSARGMTTDVRPVQFAYGVVLQRLHRPKEATAAFSNAARHAAGAYPPAYEAWVSSLLAARQWTAAAEALRDYGGILVDKPEAWADAKDRRASADWLGRAVSAAILVAPQGNDVQRFASVDERLRKDLTTDVSVDYLRGFDEVIELHEQLADTGEKSRQEAKVAQEKERETERAVVTDQQGQVASQRENLKLTADEWKKRLDEKQAEFAKQLGQLEKDWNTQDQKRQSVDRSILLAQQEAALLTQQYQALANNERPSLPERLRMQQVDGQINQRAQQLIQYQLERDRTLAAMQAVYQQATAVLAQRQALIQDYERATGQLVKQDESLRKWNDRLSKQKTALEEVPTGQTAATQAIDQKRKSIGTYLPVDWEAIRQRLLTEYGDE
jgi:hypothetical protein